MDACARAPRLHTEALNPCLHAGGVHDLFLSRVLVRDIPNEWAPQTSVGDDPRTCLTVGATGKVNQFEAIPVAG